MNDVKHLLDVAASADRTAPDPLADLARARAAARRRAAGRLCAGTAGLALAAVAAVGITQVVAGDSARPGTAATKEGVVLVSQRLDADPYTFGLTPRGWSVQSQNAFRVTIAPNDGSTSTNPDVFAGKLVILFDQNPPSGKHVMADGRDFWIGSDSDYTTISTRTRRDEPPGMVRVQYPNDAGWTRATMLAFLGSVHVGPGALPGRG